MPETNYNNNIARDIEYNKYYSCVYRYCLKELKNNDDALEVTQRAFAFGFSLVCKRDHIQDQDLTPLYINGAKLQIKQFRDEMKSTIKRREILKTLACGNRIQYITTTSPLDELIGQEEQEKFQDVSQKAQGIIRELIDGRDVMPIDKAIYNCCVSMGWSRKKTATHLNITAEKVRVRLFRLKKTIVDYLSEQGITKQSLTFIVVLDPRNLGSICSRFVRISNRLRRVMAMVTIAVACTYTWNNKNITSTELTSVAQKVGPIEIKVGEMGQIVLLSLTADGRYFASTPSVFQLNGIDQIALSIGETRTGRIVHNIKEEGIVDAAFSPDGRKLAFTTQTGKLKLYDMMSQQIEAIASIDELDSSAEVIFCPDGSKILVTGNSRAFVLDARSKEQMCVLGNVDDIRGDSCFSPDGRYVATITIGQNSKRYVSLFNAETGREIWRNVPQHSDRFPESFPCIAYSPDAKTVAFGSESGRVTILNAEDGRINGMLISQAGCIEALEFSPNGKYLVTGGSDHLVRFWDYRYRKLMSVFGKHKSQVTNICIDKLGSIIATASFDRVIIQDLYSMMGHK